MSVICLWGLRRSAPPATDLVHGEVAATFPGLLVQTSAVVLGVALVWLWVVTTLTVGTLLRGRVPRRAGRGRRLVLVLCGVAVAAGLAAPASAQGGDGRSALAGLALPDRVSAPPTENAPEKAGPEKVGTTRPAHDGDRSTRAPHVVAVGDSLWSIARTSSPAGTDLDARWREIWQANRAVVGEDPDLILPGQRLELPAVDQELHHDDVEGGTR